MNQSSRLEIIVDARNAKKQVEDFNKGLKEAEKSGESLSSKSAKIGTSFKSAGDNAKQANDKVKGFGGSLDNLSKSVGGASFNLGGLSSFTKVAALGIASVAGAAVGAVAGLTALAIQFANNAAEIERFAYLADASTTEFQKMAVGAKQMGVSGEQLSDILKDFNEKIGEFVTTGGGEAKDAFEQLNKQGKMTVDQTKALALEIQNASGPEGLQLYVNALEKAGVSHEQMSFYVENMGNDLTKLLPLLYNNGEGMKAWADAAERAGAIMDEATIKKAKELQVQTELLQLQLTGMKNQIMQAVVPALVNIADAFFSSTEKGVQLKDIADGLATTLKVLGTVAIGVATNFKIVATSISSAASMASIVYGGLEDTNKYLPLPARIAQSMYQNKDQLLKEGKQLGQNIADSVNAGFETGKKIWDNKISESVKQLAGFTTPKPSKNGLSGGLKDFGDSLNKDSKSKRKKENHELERQYREREKIRYKYADKERKIELDLDEEIERIRKARFDPSVEQEYIAVAKNRAEMEKQLYLGTLQYEANEFFLTEQEKLDMQYELNRLRVVADKDMRDDLKDMALDSLTKQLEIETSRIRLSQEQRLFQAKQFLYSEIDAMRERYRLEREEILLNTSITEEEQQKRIALLKSQEQLDVLDKATQYSREWDGTYADMTGNSAQYRLREDMLSRSAQSTNLAGAQNSALDIEAQDPNANLEEIAAKREEIWQAHHERMKMIEQQYQVNSLSLQMSYGEQIAGSFASMFKDMGGEQSKYYRVAFAAEKAFAIAQSGLAIQQGISKAIGLGFPQNIPVIAQTVAEGAKIISAIKAISNPQGFATGGKIYGAGTTTSDSIPIMASNKEFMIKASSAEKIGTDTLNYMNRTGEIPYQERRQFEAINQSKQVVVSQPNIIINNYTNEKVETSTAPNGDLLVQIGKMIDNAVDRGIDRNMKQGYRLGNALKGMK